MFCPQCGRSYPEKVNFCSHCGAAMSVPRIVQKKLIRSRRNRKIAGVCGGFAEYLDIDATLVRLVWLMLALFGGWGLIGYIVAWIILPEEPAPEAASSTAASPTSQLAPNR